MSTLVIADKVYDADAFVTLVSGCGLRRLFYHRATAGSNERLTRNAYDRLSDVAIAYGVLEAKVSYLLGHEEDSRPVMIWHDPRFYQLLKELKPESLDGETPKAYFDSIQQLRNIAVHCQHHCINSMKSMIQESLAKIKKFIAAIEAVPEAMIQRIRDRGRLMT